MAAKRWIPETLFDPEGFRMTFEVEKVLYEMQTEHQHLVLFQHRFFGKVLMLDGATQVTTKDEFVYHEMMTHVPIVAHGKARKVLIIGGGDGGILREVLKHPGVALCHMVDIDDMVVEISKKYLPTLSDGAFENPRGQVVIADGCKFVKETTERYEVVIVDSTDPLGPGAALFTEEFYADCRGCMTPGGIIVTQSGVPFAQPDEFPTTRNRLRTVFKDASLYLASVPTYACGFMAMGWGSDDPEKRAVTEQMLADRFGRAGFKTKYYTPAIHRAAFQHPAWIAEALK